MGFLSMARNAASAAKAAPELIRLQRTVAAGNKELARASERYAASEGDRLVHALRQEPSLAQSVEAARAGERALVPPAGLRTGRQFDVDDRFGAFPVRMDARAVVEHATDGVLSVRVDGRAMGTNHTLRTEIRQLDDEHAWVRVSGLPGVGDPVIAHIQEQSATRASLLPIDGRFPLSVTERSDGTVELGFQLGHDHKRLVLTPRD